MRFIYSAQSKTGSHLVAEILATDIAEARKNLESAGYSAIYIADLDDPSMAGMVEYIRTGKPTHDEVSSRSSPRSPPPPPPPFVPTLSAANGGWPSGMAGGSGSRSPYGGGKGAFAPGDATRYDPGRGRSGSSATPPDESHGPARGGSGSASAPSAEYDSAASPRSGGPMEADVFSSIKGVLSSLDARLKGGASGGAGSAHDPHDPTLVTGPLGTLFSPRGRAFAEARGREVIGATERASVGVALNDPQAAIAGAANTAAKAIEHLGDAASVGVAAMGRLWDVARHPLRAAEKAARSGAKALMKGFDAATHPGRAARGFLKSTREMGRPAGWKKGDKEGRFSDGLAKRVKGAGTAIGSSAAVALRLIPDALSALSSTVEGFASRGKDLEAYSPDLALANSKADIARLSMDYREADELGPQMAEMIENQIKAEATFREIMLPIKSFMLDVINWALEGILHGVVSVLDGLNDILDFFTVRSDKIDAVILRIERILAKGVDDVLFNPMDMLVKGLANFGGPAVPPEPFGRMPVRPRKFP